MRLTRTDERARGCEELKSRRWPGVSTGLGVLLAVGLTGCHDLSSGEGADAKLVNALTPAKGPLIPLAALDIPDDCRGDSLVLVADFDANSSFDVALIPEHGAAKLCVAVQNEAGTALTLARANMPSLSDVRTAVARDFDGDGDTDLLLAQASGSVRLLLNDQHPTGTLGFRDAPPSVWNQHPGRGALAVGDFDRDGDQDILVLDHLQSAVLFKNTLRETAALGFTAVSDVLHQSSSPGHPDWDRAGSLEGEDRVAVADFTADGRPDVFVSRPGGTFLLVQRADGGFDVTSVATGLGGGLAVNGVGAGDFDGDGDSDVVLSSVDGKVAVYVNDGAGNLSAQLIGDLGHRTGGLTVADVTGDGHPDVVVTSASERSPHAIFSAIGVQNGKPSFGLVPTDVLPAPRPGDEPSALDDRGRLGLAIPSDHDGKSKLYTRQLITTVTLDKTSVCQGDTVLVKASAAPAGALPTSVTIDGKPGDTRYVSLDGLPGTRKIIVAIGTANGYAEVREIDVAVVACAGQKFPLVAATANRFHDNTADLRVVNAADLGLTSAIYSWSFGDGQSATTSAPFVSHDYGPALSRDTQISLFQASVDVAPATGPTLTARKTMAVPNFYAINRSRGRLLVPAVRQARALATQGSALVGGYTLTNLEDEAVTLGSRYLEYQFCDNSLEPQRTSPDSQGIALAAREQRSVSISLDPASIPNGACRVAVYFTGQSASGVPAFASVYFEIQAPPRAPLDDPAWLAVFRQVVDQHLVANPDHFTEEDLLRLAAEGKIVLPATAPVLGPTLLAAPDDSLMREVCTPGASPPDGIQDLTCQAAFDVNGNPEMVVGQPYLENAVKGDIVLSSACGIVGTLLRSVYPPQLYSHSGLMVDNNQTIRDSTAVEDRMVKNFKDALDPLHPKQFRPDVLKYGWPGPVTQSVDHSYNGERVVDPDGQSWTLSPFNESDSRCAGDETLTHPRVLKAPIGSGDAGRVPLRAAADAANGILGNYRFFAYTRSDLMAQELAPAEAGWAVGTPGNMCASFIWMSFGAGTTVSLEGMLEDRELAFSGVSQTNVDGLYGYSAAQRMAAANALYGSLYDQVSANAGIFAGIAQALGVPDTVANTVVNCFASDNCADSSSGWRNGVGDGIAVSPDNLMMWDVYGNNEGLIYREREVTRVYRWAPSAGSGSVTGHVVDVSGGPVADVDLVLGGALDTVSGSDGSFKFDAVRAGTYVLNASKVIDDVPNRGHKDVTVTAGANTDVTIVIESDETHRQLNVVGLLAELADFDTAGNEFHRNVPIEYHLSVNPGTRSNSATFEDCVDHDVKVRIIFSVSLNDDLKTLHVCGQQGLLEISSPGPNVCGKDVDVSDPGCVDLGPGGSVNFDDGGALCADDCGSDNHAIWSAILSNTKEILPP